MNLLHVAGALSAFLSNPVSPPMPTEPPREFPAHCSESYSKLQHTFLRSYWDAVLSSCLVTIDPEDAYTLVYRSYSLDENGLLMVFNSYGDGPDDTMTGARDYYFFPRRIFPAYRYRPGAGLEARVASGATFTIDPSTARLNGYSAGELVEDPEVRKENRGGVEIRIRDGLLLDAGFALGKSPEARPDETSEFRDGHGGSCLVRNSEVFTLTGSGDVHPRFATDAALADFLVIRCPQLDASSLR